MLSASKKLSSLVFTTSAALRPSAWRELGFRTIGTSALRFRDHKAELIAKQMSNDNPFDTYVVKPEAGRGMFLDAPILIPSTRDTRWEDWKVQITSI